MDRAGFVQKCREILFQDTGFLDNRAVAKLGAAEGHMLPAEVNRLESKSELPDWLIAELELTFALGASKLAVHDVIQTGTKYSCTPPEQLGSGFLPRIFQSKSFRAPDLTVTSGGHGVFILQNFLQFARLDDGFVPEISDPGAGWAWELLKHRTPVRLHGSTFICITEGSSVFTHWLLDTMPRFKIAEMGGFSIGDFDNIVLVTAQASFHREGLEALGIDKQKIHVRNKLGPLIECDSFCVASTPRKLYAADPWMYEFIGNIFDVAPIEKPNRRIFIGRGASKRRPLFNEAELRPLLDEFGFDIVDPGSMSVRDMAQLCARCSHVVGAHGAGLSNLVFLPPGGKVLELYGAHISHEYWLICNQRGHRYLCMQGQDAQRQDFVQAETLQMGFFERNALGYTIDPTRFRQALVELCQS